MKNTGGRLLVECIKNEGVDFVFGIPGGQTLAIMDALYDTPDIRFITAHHEGGASCMADGYGRTTGKPGVCLATAGPGATNLLTGIGGALKDSSPVVVITANNFGVNLGRDDAQEATPTDIFRSLCKWSFLVTDAERIPHAVREAFHRARSGCPGPTHLDFTRDVLEDETDCSCLSSQVAKDFQFSNRQRGDSRAIDEAVKILIKAKAPTIWAGRGVLISEATEAILQLADQLHIPMISTYNGIGSIPADHPLSFGPKSRHGTRVSTQVLAESDAVLAIGNSLNGPSTSRWQLELPKQLLQIDIDPLSIGRHYPCAVGICGDARAVTEEILSALKNRVLKESISENRMQWISRLTQVQNKWKQDIFRKEYQEASLVKPALLMEKLRACLPRNSIVVGGAGNPGIWTNLLEIYEPRTYMKPVGFGNMGFGLPAAIAASLAQPDRKVACVVGDGSLGMCISEIETSVRENAPVLIIVMNNHGYGNIKQEQLVYHGPRYIGVDFLDTDFATIAKGFGADGIRVERPDQLVDSLRLGLASEKTFLVDVLIDPTDNVWTEPF